MTMIVTSQKRLRVLFKSQIFKRLIIEEMENLSESKICLTQIWSIIIENIFVFTYTKVISN